jgi:hypothetical protein
LSGNLRVPDNRVEVLSYVRWREGADRTQNATPHKSNTAPHQTLACKWYSTTFISGGCDISYKPAHRINNPFTSSEIPIKNQIEIAPSVFIELTRKAR